MGTFCIGAAIFDENGRVMAACSTSGSDPEILGSRMDHLAALVMQCADDISRRMGYVGQRPSAVPANFTTAAGAALAWPVTASHGDQDAHK